MKQEYGSILRMFGKMAVFTGVMILSAPAFAAQGLANSETNISATVKRQIMGTVKDIKGEPLPGAGVSVKGKSAGTVSDINGSFTLNSIDEKDVLVFSCLGFKDVEVKIGSSNTIDVIMEEDSRLLEEVVVIGYGSSRKEDLSTSIAQVKVDNVLKSRPASLGSFVQGLMPGVTLQSSGGDPMASESISIRGRGSRGSDDNYNSGDGVLYVVDGVPGAPFNMEDVESITVLKDAASAAIYGASVGSGGVIVITTKQASAGKIRLNVNISKSFKQAWRKPQTLTAEEYNKVWKDAVGEGGHLPKEANPEIFPYGAVTRTNWMDEIFRIGSLDHYAVSLSGGSDYLKAFASVSYDEDKGILQNTFSKKLGSKLNFDFKVTDWMNVLQTVTFQYTNGQGDLKTGHQGVLVDAVLFPRSATLYDYDKSGNILTDDKGNKLYHGTVPRWAVNEGFGGGYGEVRNPLASLLRLDQLRPSTMTYSTTSLVVKPVSGLVLKSDFTAGLSNASFDEFVAKVPEIGRTDEENRRNIRNDVNFNWLWENTASYSTILGDAHHISAMAGYTMKYDKYQYYKFQANRFNSEDRYSTILQLAGAYNKERPEEGIWEESMISAFGRLGYSYDDRYFVTASLRYDASSKLYKTNNYGIFPAISASWKISSEPFFSGLKQYVNLLKLRTSWGQVGNVALVPRYSWNVPMKTIKDPVIHGKNSDVTITNAWYASSISVRDLKWETTEQYGLGLDMGLFGDKLTFGLDYFHKITKDLIEKVPVPSVLGVEEEPYGNVGKVLNNGVELSVNYNQTIGEVQLKMFGNMSYINNKVLDLGTRQEMVHTNTINSLKPLASTVGQPWYSYKLIKTAGIFKTQEEIDNYTWTDPDTGLKKIIQPNAKPGDLKFEDYNNDGIINTSDSRYLGSFMPTVTYGFGASLAWRGFDFNVIFQGIAGNKIFNGFKQIGLTGRQQGGNMLKDILKSWTYDKNSNIPRLALTDDSNGNFSTPSDFYLEDGSYMRLKNITLGYTLPKSLLSRAGLRNNNVRFYVSGENLLTFTKYSGFDPEVGNFGIDAGTYPVARIFSLGLNFNF